MRSIFMLALLFSIAWSTGCTKTCTDSQGQTSRISTFAKCAEPSSDSSSGTPDNEITKIASIRFKTYQNSDPTGCNYGAITFGNYFPVKAVVHFTSGLGAPVQYRAAYDRVSVDSASWQNLNTTDTCVSSANADALIALTNAPAQRGPITIYSQLKMNDGSISEVASHNFNYADPTFLASSTYPYGLTDFPAQNKYLITTQSSGNYYAQMFDRKGTAVGSSFDLGYSVGGALPLAVGSDLFVVSNNTTIQIRHFNSSGTLVAGPVDILPGSILSSAATDGTDLYFVYSTGNPSNEMRVAKYNNSLAPIASSNALATVNSMAVGTWGRLRILNGRLIVGRPNSCAREYWVLSPSDLTTLATPVFGSGSCGGFGTSVSPDSAFLNNAYYLTGFSQWNSGATYDSAFNFQAPWIGTETYNSFVTIGNYLYAYPRSSMSSSPSDIRALVGATSESVPHYEFLGTAQAGNLFGESSGNCAFFIWNDISSNLHSNLFCLPIPF